MAFYHQQKRYRRTQYAESKRPLEATVKNKLERELDADLSDVMIYSDGDTQRFLSTAMLLALTVGDKVYLRQDADKEGSIETDKTLLHEMVHIIQNKNKVKINSTEDMEKAEAEAEQAEYYANGDIWTEPYEIIEVGGEKYKFTEKDKKRLVNENINYLVRWIERQKYVLEEKKYLEHLCSVESFCKNNPFCRSKSPYEAMLYETVEGLRMKLGIL